MKTERSVRLNPISASTLGNTAATNGEIFYDTAHKTLRLFDGKTKGGFQLLRADLSNAIGSFGATVSATAPASPTAGSQWLNSNTGILYTYYKNSNGQGQWIQPITVPVGHLTPSVSLPVASLFTLGAVKVDGSSITITEDGTISAVSSNSFTNSNFVGVTTTSINSTEITELTGATGVVEHNVGLGTVFHHTGVVSNFTADFVNVPTTNNRTITLSLIIDQTNPAYIADNIQINGTGQIINWAGGIVPTGHISNTDVITFFLIRSSNSWTVFGSLSTHGA